MRFGTVFIALIFSVAALPAIAGDSDAFEAQLDRADFSVTQKSCVVKELNKGGKAVDYDQLTEYLSDTLDEAAAQGMSIGNPEREEIVLSLAEGLPFFAAFDFGTGDPKRMSKLSKVSSSLLTTCLPLFD